MPEVSVHKLAELSPDAREKLLARAEPEQLDRTRELVSVMRDKTPDDLSSMMGISAQLGELNFERHAFAVTRQLDLHRLPRFVLLNDFRQLFDAGNLFIVQLEYNVVLFQAGDFCGKSAGDAGHFTSLICRFAIDAEDGILAERLRRLIETEKFQFYFKRFLNPEITIQVKPLESKYRHLLEHWISNTGLSNVYLDQYLIMFHYYFNKILWTPLK